MSGSDRSTGDLQRRIAALDPARRQVLRLALERRTTAIDGNGPAVRAARPEQLTAYVVGVPADGFDARAIKQHVAERLPDYMVPQAVWWVDALPRTSAGKLDRAALISLNAGAAPTDAAMVPVVPENEGDPVEPVLTGIWADVLGLSEVGRHENFFELGGDSLLSIRILARTSQAGLHISPERFFALPTVAEQAAEVSRAGTVRVARGPISGSLPLLPIQHWFFARIRVDSHHWNQCFLFRLQRAVDLSDLERAVHSLLLHHDALRLCFADPPGEKQSITPPGVSVPVSTIDLSGVEEADLRHCVEANARELNRSFRLGQPPQFGVLLVISPQGEPDRLVVAAHHLVVDGVSWRILLEDLEVALDQLGHGEPVRFAARTSSIKSWAERLVQHAQTPEVGAELGYWLSASGSDPALPLAVSPPADANTVADARMLRNSLSAADTHCILHEFPVRFRTRVQEALVAALAMTLGRWMNSDIVRLDLEGHGREALFDDVDVSRTVGWFTSVYPVCLHSVGADVDQAATLIALRDQLRAVPSGGIGYGLLRELSADEATRQRLRRLPDSKILFNYLGQIDKLSTEGSILELEDGAFGQPRATQGQRAYLLEINTHIEAGRLQIRWDYGSAFLTGQTVENLASGYVDALSSLVERARQPESQKFTPSDFPLAEMDQGELDNLAEFLNEIDSKPPA